MPKRCSTVSSEPRRSKPIERLTILSARQSCAVNAEVINLWIEDGLNRRAIRHSANGGDEDYLNDIFCPYFKPEGNSSPRPEQSYMDP